MTAVLESSRRFFIPAIAPLFYNIGIIVCTVIYAESLGLMAPVIGVVAGSFLHFIVQFPLAYKLGFRFKTSFVLNGDVKKVAKLALPRIVETSFLQVSKMVELYFASLISVAAYTYYTFGNTLQLLPVGLFGLSIAKAALPTLTEKSEKMD